MLPMVLSFACLFIWMLLFIALRSRAQKEIKSLKKELLDAKNLNQTHANNLSLLEKREEDQAHQIKGLREERDLLFRQVTAYEEGEKQRQQTYDERLGRLVQVYEKQEKERVFLQEQEKEKQLEEQKALEAIWQRHEQSVSEKMKLFCQKHSIELLPPQDFPFKGRPDHVIRIADEYVIFDSKAPEKKDFVQFQSYLKAQADGLKKYVQFPSVRKDLFFIVPSSALAGLTQTSFFCGTYRVFLLTEETLEPILVNLKQLESYEFAAQMSPEDRWRISHTLGQMMHHLKRRVQVDAFFAEESFHLLNESRQLPEDILQDSEKVEKGSKLNPPQERRSQKLDDQILQTSQQMSFAKFQALDMPQISEVAGHGKDGQVHGN